jgi:microcystin-dependent protein
MSQTQPDIKAALLALFNAAKAAPMTEDAFADGEATAIFNAVSGGMVYKGTWDCSVGYYPSNPVTGYVYICNVAGTISGTHYLVGDWLVYNGTSWDKISSASASFVPITRMINGYALSGDITLTKSDIGLANVQNLDQTNPSNITQDATHRFISDAQLATLANMSGSVTGINTGDETSQRIGTIINNSTLKASPADSDLFGYADASAAWILKNMSWGNTKTSLKTYFDGFYGTAQSGVMLQSVYDINNNNIVDKAEAVADTSGNISTALQVANAVSLASSIQTMPTASIFIWGNVTPPTGCALCNGAEVSRTGTYAGVFAIIGTTFGIGNNTTTFNLPDMSDLFAINMYYVIKYTSALITSSESHAARTDNPHNATLAQVSNNVLNNYSSGNIKLVSDAVNKYGFITADNNNNLCSNVYFDGANWRMNTTGSGTIIQATKSGGANLVIANGTSGNIANLPSIAPIMTNPAGSANQRLFLNAANTGVEWGFGSKVVAYTRDMTATSGDVSYTGAGRKPRSIIVFFNYILSHYIGLGDINNSCWEMGLYGTNLASTIFAANYLGFLIEDAAGTKYQQAILKTLDADGCTITWAKGGTPSAGTGNFVIMYLF